MAWFVAYRHSIRNDEAGVKILPGAAEAIAEGQRLGSLGYVITNVSLPAKAALKPYYLALCLTLNSRFSAKMVPLYAAQISDLGPGDRVKIECPCGQLFPRLTAAMLGAAGIPSHIKLLDLKRQLKCQSCRWRGRGEVSIEWAE
jgi:hypothetical protein